MDSKFYHAAEKVFDTYSPYVSGTSYDKSVSDADMMLVQGGGNCFAFSEAVGATMLANPDTKRVIITLSSVTTDRRRVLHTACTAISHQNESLLIDFYRNEGNEPIIDTDTLLLSDKIRPERVVYTWTRHGSDTIRALVRRQDAITSFRWPKNTMGQRVHIDYPTALPMLRSIALLEEVKRSGGEEAFEKARAKHALPRLPRR